MAKSPLLEDGVIVYCGSEDHQKEVRAAVCALDGVEILEWEDRTHHLHLGGKIEISGTSPLLDVDDLSMAYTPGVARVCMEIARDEAVSQEYTVRKNTVFNDVFLDATLGDRSDLITSPSERTPNVPGAAQTGDRFGSSLDQNYF